MKTSPFQFKEPSLQSLSFELNPDFQNNDNIAIYERFNVKVSKNKDNRSALVALTYEMNKEKNIPFFVKAEIRSVFVWDTELENDTIDSLLEHNAPALLLGYLRPIVANLIANAGFPPYNIPFMDFR